MAINSYDIKQEAMGNSENIILYAITTCVAMYHGIIHSPYLV